MKLVPLPAFRYGILLKESGNLLDVDALVGAALLVAGGGFTECSGLEVTLETLDYPEGGRNGFVHRLPTRSKPSDIVLKRGLLVASDLWAWVRRVADGVYERRDGAIIQLGYSGLPLQTWLFRRGLPLKWTGPTLNASQNGVATESLTIAHEGLDQLGLSSLLV
jgi:phage tail-like protein